MEFSCVVVKRMQLGLELVQLLLIANGEVDVRRVVIGRSAVLVGVLNGCMGSLNSLLREWDIAAGDGVQVVLLSDSRFHDRCSGWWLWLNLLI
jgi:hypothetical protein